MWVYSTSADRSRLPRSAFMILVLKDICLIVLRHFSGQLNSWWRRNDNRGRYLLVSSHLARLTVSVEIISHQTCAFCGGCDLCGTIYLQSMQLSIDSLHQVDVLQIIFWPRMKICFVWNLCPCTQVPSNIPFGDFFTLLGTKAEMIRYSRKAGQCAGIPHAGV